MLQTTAKYSRDRFCVTPRVQLIKFYNFNFSFPSSQIDDIIRHTFKHNAARDFHRGADIDPLAATHRFDRELHGAAKQYKRVAGQ